MSSPIGERLRRREDPAMIQGQARYVGDIRLPGMLHAAFVRSPHAHARITSLDLAKARGMPGVVAAFGAHDLPALGHPIMGAMERPDIAARTESPLAAAVVRYDGAPVTLVVADDPYHAADAAAAVSVGYDILPPALDPVQAQRDGAPLVHDDVPRNVAARVTRSTGALDDAFAAPDVVLHERFVTSRGAGLSIETRGVVAAPSGEDGVALTLWDSTQAPHVVRRAVAAALALPQDAVRVVTPAVGGAFGPKGRIYPEEIALGAVALSLGRPVSWQATRSEDLRSTYQGRGIIIDAALAARADGTILGLRATLTQDCGAYLPNGVVVPESSAQHLIGPYRVPAMSAEIVAVYTHKVPLTPLRGGGREGGVFAMERLLDHLARELQLDPLEVRRRNALRPDEFPHDTGYPNPHGPGTIVYDSGDYPTYLDKARALIGYDDVRRAQPEERAAGLYRGVAVTLFLEATGLAKESARVEVADDGGVHVTVGSPSNGQSHATTFAQVCAARLGVPVDKVTVTSGDTAAMGEGTGTFASRMAVMGGNAVALAARDVRRRALDAAAALLDVSAGDLELAGGIVSVRGVPGRTIALAEVARQLRQQGGGEALQATHSFAPDHPVCYAGGAHAALVAVDPETGRVEVRRYVVVHDCGTVINPTVVEGQMHGGVTHGLGNALHEAAVVDDVGRLVTDQLWSYAVPRAQDVPPFEVEHQAQPSPYNPEGIKGAGEGGVIGSLATIAAAVEDALAPRGLTLNSLPIRSEQLSNVNR